ncbi:hypothetical protein KNV00_gp079 [Streptomyces phage Bmoc]|uniref:Uncharacterized protein n=4 Tax=Samistivirus TaxID=2560220 RepID=A0A6M3T0C8_9CAUD|nr:hypothetical protein AXJ18_gp088 [Streptomyces phage Jay2Jay]YP_010103560.1 hypothetical protein KNU67_gp081 [Streptomyces phage Evy]YP_010107591.1 hypothetical protein KNV00_gp079 [Streptomyces phage Bmoc]ASN73260.1 hypothetical protein SEA_WARPY_229 [Streptomyces phage Warpy]UEM46972.1 hypothetical protein SEA_TARGARYEN_226 [Streptomyces phage Targaryen]AIW02686.1 hypothetical protein PBI_JAY2JAY_232 [Streptomyces phage Jay2Jay]QDH94051.1 hypothetical protein SEA_EVY_216 [Streptomyces ph
MRELVCDSCGGQRFSLTSVQSKLLGTMSFNLCNGCKDDGREPRWLIVLAARNGQDVSPWLDNKLYDGAEIKQEDLN